VAQWLTHVRGLPAVAEVRLGPLTRDEMAVQVAGLAGSPVPAPVVDEMYTRTEGNPFFTEQLVGRCCVDRDRARWSTLGVGSVQCSDRLLPLGQGLARQRRVRLGARRQARGAGAECGGLGLIETQPVGKASEELLIC
jgi:hypothetical protein